MFSHYVSFHRPTKPFIRPKGIQSPYLSALEVQEKQFFYIEFSTFFKLTMLILQNQYLPNFLLFEFLKTSSMHYKVQRDLEVKAFFLGPYFRSGSNLASSCQQLKYMAYFCKKVM